jgi:hypothetical protein
VTWDCRDAAGTLVPDGTYFIMVEMTTREAQGPVTPSGWIRFAKGTSTVTTRPFNQRYFTAMSLTYTPRVSHDIAVTGLRPSAALAGTFVPILIDVTNRQAATESFSVSLRDATAGTAIGSAQVNALRGGARATATVLWNTRGLAPGTRSLLAAAGPVAGETNTADNTRIAPFALTNAAAPAQVHDVAILAVAPQGEAFVGDTVDVQVKAANLGQSAENFTVRLNDTTAGRLLGTAAVSNMPAGGSSDLVFPWGTLGQAPGAHTLVATASLSTDTLAANNQASAVGAIVSTGFVYSPLPVTGSFGGYCGAVARSGGVLAAGFGATFAVLADSRAAGSLVRLGSVRLPGRIEALAVAGTHAYAACGASGLHVVDIADPAAPAYRLTLRTTGQASGVAVDGRLLFVAEGSAGLRILDLADPAAPTLLGAYRSEGPVRAVAASGGLAYLLDAYAGVVILNVARPASPVIRGFYVTGYGDALALAGAHAYVADRAGQFLAVDISDPSSPVLAGSLTLKAAGQAIAVSGGRAYVAAGAEGVIVVNVENPAAPGVAGGLATPGDAAGLAVSGSGLLVAAGFGGLVDAVLPTPDAPVVADAFAAANPALGVGVCGGRACVAAGALGVFIYDVSDPSDPSLLGVSADCRDARAVAVDGNLVGVADGTHGVRLLDAADPAAPVLLGSYAAADLGPVVAVALAGDLLLAADAHRVIRLDVSAPSAPRVVAAYAAPGRLFDLATDGTLAAAAAGDAGVLLFDVSGASRLDARSVVDTVGSVSAVALAGRTVYAADGPGGWIVLDAANPATPVVISRFTTPALAVALNAATAGVADSAQLIVLDAAVPLQPLTVRSVAPFCQIRELSAAGGLLFAAEGDAGVSIIPAD